VRVVEIEAVVDDEDLEELAALDGDVEGERYENLREEEEVQWKFHQSNQHLLTWKMMMSRKNIKIPSIELSWSNTNGASV
jgi:hypothetical protein